MVDRIQDDFDLPTETEIVHLLSQPRISSYKTATDNQSITAALGLYQWNVRISAAFYESIQYLEIALRNTISEAINIWHDTHHTDPDPWYRCPVMPHTEAAKTKVKQAVFHATGKQTRPELPDRVIAELPFGYWCSLLSEEYNRTLWQPILQYSFPSAKRGRLHNAIGELLTIRNRIAHYEPIHQRNLQSDFDLLLKTAEYVHISLAKLIKQTSTVPLVLNQKPHCVS